MLKRFENSLKDNGIDKIMVIDDVFDSPIIDNENAGDILEMLDTFIYDPEVFNGDFEDRKTSAVNLINQSEFESEEVKSFIKDVYYNSIMKLIKSGLDDELYKNPLLAAKQSNIAAIIPLMSLLDRMKDIIKVIYTGLDDEPMEMFKDFNPHLVLLDYYLSASYNEDGTDESRVSVSNSQSLLKKMFEKTNEDVDPPSVILMSSQDVENKAGRFRSQVNNALPDNARIKSWRFGFMSKSSIRLDQKNIILDHIATDSLLDVCQAYSFGGHLDRGLTLWKENVGKAIQEVFEEVSELDLKDFAYLLRFRLKPENERLSEYFRWLFSESLMSAIQRQPNNPPIFGTLDDLSASHPTDQIGGAYEGVTLRIARMFHHARFSERSDASEQHRIGDVYSIDGTNKVRGIITPDCDLAKRSDGSCNQPIPLTIQGTITEPNTSTSLLTDLIVLGQKKIRNINWSPDIMSFEEISLKSNPPKYTYLGTLKPLYAQDLQKRALNHLSRVGLEVAPTIGFNASASVQFVVHGPEKKAVNALKKIKRACTVIMPRGGRDPEATVIFFRSFYNQLIESMREIKPAYIEKLPEKLKLLLESAIAADGGDLLYKDMCVDGLRVGIAGASGIVVQKKYEHNDDAFYSLIVDINGAEREE